MAQRDLLADMHSINALGLEPAVAKGGDKAKLKQMPSQKLSHASTLKADFKSSLDDITKAMDKNKKKAEDDAAGGSASPVPASTAATSQPLSSILDAFLNATKAASSSTATIAWANSTGPSYKQILGEPTPSAAPAASVATNVAPAPAATGGAYVPPQNRGGQKNGQGQAPRGAPAQEQPDRGGNNRDRNNRRNQRDSQGGQGNSSQNQWGQQQQSQQQQQQFQQQPGQMGGMMMMPQGGAMMMPQGGAMMMPQGFDQSQQAQMMQMMQQAQMMQMGYPGQQQDGGRGGGKGGGGAGGQNNDQQAQMMQMMMPGGMMGGGQAVMMPVGMMPQGGQAVMMPMMMGGQAGGQQMMMMPMMQQPGQQ